MQTMTDPVSILTQAALSSMFTAAMSFTSNIVGHMFVKPMIDQMSVQLANMMKGGLSSISEGNPGAFFNNFKLPPPTAFPPPPIGISVSPDGMLQMSIPTNEVMSRFSPLFAMMEMMGNNGGESQ